MLKLPVITRGYATLAFSIFSGVSPFVSPNKKREVPMRKINVKQLTAVESIVKNGKKQFYFRYYCPDSQKDNVKKFAYTEAEAFNIFCHKQTEFALVY